jgi:multimeric flavodoxin WrbA
MKAEELQQKGWKQASITGGEHLKRILEIYEELGIEVYIEEISPEECGGCTECYKAANETIYRIYTRSAR